MIPYLLKVPHPPKSFIDRGNHKFKYLSLGGWVGNTLFCTTAEGEDDTLKYLPGSGRGGSPENLKGTSLHPMVALWGRESREVEFMTPPHTREARELYFYSKIKVCFCC